MNSIGVHSAAIAHGANATMFDAFDDFTPAQQQQFRDQILGETYQHFVNLVASRRGLSVARVDQIAQGRVWTGDDAIKLKLVDGIGGLDEAIKAARELAKVPEDTKLGLLELPAPPGLLSSLMKGKMGAEGALGIGVSAHLRALLWMFDAAAGAHGGWLRSGTLSRYACDLTSPEKFTHLEKTRWTRSLKDFSTRWARPSAPAAASCTN